MAYTILSAQYANEDSSSAVIETSEAAAVLVSERDTPDLWADMLAWGEPASFAPSPAPAAITFKADIWRRATDEEAPVLVSLLEQQSLRKQMIFRDCGYLDHSDPDFLLLKAAVAQALNSEERASLILAPSD